MSEQREIDFALAEAVAKATEELSNLRLSTPRRNNLLVLVDKVAWLARKTGHANASRSELARMLGWSVSKLEKYIRFAEGEGILHRVERFSQRDGVQLSNALKIGPKESSQEPESAQSEEHKKDSRPPSARSQQVRGQVATGARSGRNRCDPSTCSDQDIPRKPPPPPSKPDEGEPDQPSGWEVVVVELLEIGLATSRRTAKECRRGGWRPSVVREFVAHYRAHAWAWEPGAVRFVLEQAPANCPPREAIWPKPREPDVRARRALKVLEECRSDYREHLAAGKPPIGAEQFASAFLFRLARQGLADKHEEALCRERWATKARVEP